MSFYRELSNRENYVKFHNQTRNPIEVIEEENDEYYDKDDMPELFDLEERDDVEFDFFDNDSDKALRFKRSLLCFPNVKNHFFYAVIYGILHDKLKQNPDFVNLDEAREVLGDELFFDLKLIESSVMLDHTIFGFFERCQRSVG